MSIAQRILVARKAKGWSQANLAEQLEVSRASCSQWERGATSPSVEHLSKLALLLDIQFEWLATGRGEREYKNLNQINDMDSDNPLESQQILSLYQLLPKNLQHCMHSLLKVQSQLVSKRGE